MSSGLVLSPHLFAIFVNDIIDELVKQKIGCRISAISVSIFVYADDIVLVAPSVGSLQILLTLLETLLENLDMHINATKSACIRFGPRYDAVSYTHLTLPTNREV